MKKWFKYPVLLAFVLFMGITTVADLLTTGRTFSELENRYLQQRPAFSWRALLSNSYTSKYETFINDQFVLRDGWITLKSLCEQALGKVENNGVVYGSGGFLFSKLLSVEEEKLADNTRYVCEFAGMYPGLPVSMMLVPGSYELMPDRLPAGAPLFKQQPSIQAVYEQVARAGVQTLDLYPVFQAEDAATLYYRTDHHWTCQGAYLAYAALCRQWGAQPVPLEGLERHEVPGFYGTFYSKAKRAGTQPDTLVWYDLPVDRVVVDGEEKPSMHQLSQFEERDKYAALLWGNHGVTELFHAGAQWPDKSLLIVKDSYANTLAPFFTANFGRVVIVDPRSLGVSMQAFLQENHFDQVLLLYSFENFAADLNIAKLRY